MPGEILNIIALVFAVAGIGFFLEIRGIGFQSETQRPLQGAGSPSPAMDDAEPDSAVPLQGRDLAQMSV